MANELSWLIGLFVGVGLVGALVARIRPEHRNRVRRMFVTFALYAIAVGLHHAFAEIDRPTWASTLDTTSELLQALLLVSLAAAIVFSVAMPSVGVKLPAIASDLVFGLASIAATIVVLARHGLDAGGALVSGAVVSAVLAISLQSTLGNILGGVALQLDGSISEGDWISWDNGTKTGRVRAVRWRHTVVEARDFSTIIVPNAVLLASSITLLGKRDGYARPQRIAVQFCVDFRFAPSQVTKLVTDALLASPIEGVADDPPPQAQCLDLSRDLSTPLVVYAAKYSLLDIAQEDPTSSRIRGRIFAALRRANIPLSAPAIMTHAEATDDGLVARREAREATSRLAVLGRVHLFKALVEDELKRLAAAMNQALYVPGEIVTRQGAVGNWLYILAQGRVEVRTNVDPDGPGGEPGRPVFVAQIEAPDFFGETALMTGEPRSADVVALTDVECYRLPKEAFAEVLLGRPALAEELSERLARRRMELLAARDGIDLKTSAARHKSERDRILGAIRGFFGL